MAHFHQCVTCIFEFFLTWFSGWQVGLLVYTFDSGLSSLHQNAGVDYCVAFLSRTHYSCRALVHTSLNCYLSAVGQREKNNAGGEAWREERLHLGGDAIFFSVSLTMLSCCKASLALVHTQPLHVPFELGLCAVLITTY